MVAVAAWLWLADADSVTAATLQRYHSWLSAGEAVRHQRFVRPQRRRQFLIGRGLLRMALGRLLAMVPQDVQLEERSANAPRLVAPVVHGGLPGFSISHSGRWVACAVSAHSALGLDIEMKAAGRDFDGLAQQAFDAGALVRWDGLRAQPIALRIDGFYQLWSEQEARFKLGLAAAAGHCVVLPHAELAVVLCSALPLAPPQIEIVTAP